MKRKPFSCDICPEKPKCKKQCAWLKHELSLVTYRQKEKPILLDERHKSKPCPEVGITSEIIFSMYFIDRMSQQEIAHKLYISQPYISKCVKKYKAILLENLKK